MKVITIGRSSENNIVINDAKVSRTHLQLVQNDNGVCSVVDLSSTNGTFVNGQKITGEVRLQPHDVIRIGNTTLPWQEYIKPSMATGQKPMDNIHPNPHPNKIWWCIAACAVFILLSGGIGLYYYYNGKKQEKIQAAKRDQEVIQKEQLHQEADQKAEKAKRLQEEADELFRKALISQNDKSKALAEEKQKEATEAKQKADAAIADLLMSETARIAAVEDKEKAIREKVATEQNSILAIQNAEEKADEAISKANEERDYVTKKAILTEKFYEEYVENWFDNNFAKKVCKQLSYVLPKKNKAKMALKNRFNESDNKGKQAIIDAIQLVKQQNSKINVNEPEVKSDSLKTTKDSEIIDSKSAEENDE